MGQQGTKETKHARAGRGDGAAGAFDSSGKIAPGTKGVALPPPTGRENILQQRHHDPMRTPFVSTCGSGPMKADDGGTSSPSSPHECAPPRQKLYPVVLRYTDEDVKTLLVREKKVCIMLEALEWKPLPMTPSEDSFYAVLELPPGNHRFRFVIDGKEVVDNKQPASSFLQDKDKLVQANVFQISEFLPMTKEDEEVVDDGEGWGQERFAFESTKKYPPIVPVHLRYTPLNTPPTAVRCTRDDVALAGKPLPPENLPLPLNVTINHVYFQRRVDHSVMGITTRYCNKYTTVVYYSTAAAPKE